jgi:hypothetical protein
MKKPKMLKGHYELIARVIREWEIGAGGRRELAQLFSYELIGTNPAFDRERFIEACVANSPIVEGK